ncbi:hypothetical protein OV320_2653 [Actinobacteria bacterium OV320]|nr:hypothetical protein OV320_2653 [Actinobacteria bacterium OV320]
MPLSHALGRYTLLILLTVLIRFDPPSAPAVMAVLSYWKVTNPKPATH